MENIIRHL